MSSCRRRKLPVALWHQVQAELKNNKKKNYKNNPNSFIKTVTSNEFITAFITSRLITQYFKVIVFGLSFILLLFF